jgi:hypothetical protein
LPERERRSRRTGAERKIQEALSALKALGLPPEQKNERSALTLLALLDLKSRTPWSRAARPLRGITQMMNFFADHYGKRYAPNTRETVRRFTVHQFLQAGLIVRNPDRPSRPTNSPNTVYQMEQSVLNLLRTYGTKRWKEGLRNRLASGESLAGQYAREREMRRIPVQIPRGKRIKLSPGGQNCLIKKVLEEFCPRFAPGAKPVYVGDTEKKWAYFDPDLLRGLGVAVDEHGKIPDVVVYAPDRKWLVLIEAVTSHGPVNPKRHMELVEMFKGAKAGLVFVTAFQDRRTMLRYLQDIAWETEVWLAEAPSHLIHFDGERFLGPPELLGDK